MKFIYPAVFRKNEEGRYKAFFPDLACCEAEGDTLDDAIDNANEAAYNWIYAEVMEDEMDLKRIKEYEADLKDGKSETYNHDEVMKMLDLPKLVLNYLEFRCIVSQLSLE